MREQGLRRTGGVLALLLLAGCSLSAARITPLDDLPPRGAPDGGHYSLPRTVLTVDMPIKRTQVTLTKLGQCVVDVQTGATLNYEIVNADEPWRLADIAKALAVAANGTDDERPTPDGVWRKLEQHLTSHEEGLKLLRAAEQVRIGRPKEERQTKPLTMKKLKDFLLTTTYQQDVTTAYDKYYRPKDLKSDGKSTDESPRKSIDDILKAALAASKALDEINRRRTPLAGGPVTFGALRVIRNARKDNPKIKKTDGTKVADEKTKYSQKELARLWFEVDGTWSARVLDLSLSPSLSFGVVGDKIVIGSRAEADPDQSFHVELRGDALEDRSVEIALSELGTIETGSSEVKDRRLPLLAKTIEFGGKLAGGIIGLSGRVKNFAEDGAADPSELSEGDISRMDEECRIATELSTNIKQLRKWRHDRHKVTAASDIRQMDSPGLKTDLDQRTAWLNELLAAFFKKSDTTWIFRASIRPRSDCAPCGAKPRFALFTLDPKAGIHIDNGWSTARQEDAPKNFRSGALGKTLFALDLGCRPEEQVARRFARAFPERPAAPRYLYYRIPAVATVSITQVAQEDPIVTPQGQDSYQKLVQRFARGRQAIAQLGVVGALPYCIDGGELKYSVEYHKALGALKKVKLVTKGADFESVVGAASGAAEGVLTAESARLDRVKANRPTPVDQEIVDLERELKRLELVNKIQEEKDKQTDPED